MVSANLKTRLGAMAVAAFSGPPAFAQELVWDRPALLDGSATVKQALRDQGISVDARLTQFYQGVIGGDGDQEWQYGGKGDLIATFDGRKLGLWKGFYVNVHQEWLYGEDANDQGDGSIYPVNTAMAFTRFGGYEYDTSLVLTQTFGERLCITAGKINVIEAAAKTPLMGVAVSIPS